MSITSSREPAQPTIAAAPPSKPNHRTAKIAPGLRQLLPLPIGIVAESRRDPLGFLTRNNRRFGDVFRYQPGPFTFHLIAHPDGVKHVLQDNHKNYPRSWLYRVTRLAIGDGLVSSEGEVWRRQRRMVQPAFHHQRVASLAGVMTAATADLLDRWQTHVGSGVPLDIAAEMIGLTLRIVGKALLSVELSEHAGSIGSAVVTALDYLNYRINHHFSLPVWVPLPRNIRFRRAKRQLDALVYGIIHERRRTGEDSGDLLSMLLTLRDEETGEAMSDLELRDQVITFIGAGHETTAVALAWTWYLISQHLDVEARMRAEIADVLGGRVPTVADLPQLTVTRNVIQEAMRLYPPVFGVVRDVVDDDEIGGYRIPAKTSVVISQYVTHHHPAVWDDPERFDPDRFTPEQSDGRAKLAYFPFLGGPHHCIGAEFAMMEAMLIVAMVMQRCRLRLAPGTHVEPQPMLTLRPKGGLPMLLERV